MNAIVVENPDHHAAYWVGADVAKKTFDAALLRPGLHYSPTTLREVPVAHFARSDQGVTDFLGWLRTQLEVIRSAWRTGCASSARRWDRRSSIRARRPPF